MKDMKQSDAGISGGTAGSVNGFTRADLERGYCKDKDKDDPYMMTHEPMPQGGFAGRPNGWER